MATMNISLPDPLKEFVDRQVREQGYGTASEYIRELIRNGSGGLNDVSPRGYSKAWNQDRRLRPMKNIRENP